MLPPRDLFTIHGFPEALIQNSYEALGQPEELATTRTVCPITAEVAPAVLTDAALH